ncbi:MAG TPA: DUF1592 domain-containing protein [Bryobacteraceae bacterium]|nr:DUF1592 domain-containing protein [Bryobacteraceae bacterium]
MGLRQKMLLDHLSRSSIALLAVSLSGVLLAGPQTASPTPSSPGATQHRAVLSKYCFGCHNERLRTGGLALDQANLADVGQNAETWEEVVHKLRAGEMPPAGLPRPDQATAGALVSWLEAGLDGAASRSPNPGRIPLHRLNRTEYVNAIRDLLALEVDGRSLLVADDVDEHGFDNIAGVLSVSPALMEQYMAAARKISKLAVGDATIVPVYDTYSIPSTLFQDQRMGEDLPFGTRGGIAVRHYFPVDGEYAIKVRLKRQLYGYILGLGRAHQLEVRVNGKLVKSFAVGGDAPTAPSPASYAGNIMGDPKWDLYMHSADAGLEFRFTAKAGASTVAVSFVKDLPESEDIPQPRETGFGLAINEFYQGNPALENMSIGGPYRVDGPGDTPSRRKIFVCRPAGATEEQPCVRKVVSTLARAAYRRPVTDREIATLLQFYEQGRMQAGFEAGVQLALERILADPNFLFRIERDPPKAAAGTVYRLSDLELASRLSFFLWSSIPDEELLRLAAAGRLKDPAILEQQVQRMLADPRSNGLVENFATEWLELPKIRSVIPDPDQFPDFDDNLRSAFQQETELFIESQMRADASILDLLRANYTFLNQRLAQHYGIPNVYGSHFRKVTFGADERERGGLLGQGSILMATSYPNRTSPVLRGKWLLDNILGTPPPPPPPNVPLLKENSGNEKPTTVRQRLEEHRQNAACAVCHVRMDPLGFALENFDAIGSWRTSSDGLPLDTAAALPDGTKFEGVAGLRKILLSRPEQFAATFTQKLLTYALGRETEYYDQPAIRKIAREAEASGYRWSSIILGIAKSTPFEMSIVKSTEKTSGGAEAAAASRSSGTR